MEAHFSIKSLIAGNTNYGKNYQVGSLVSMQVRVDYFGFDDKSEFSSSTFKARFTQHSHTIQQNIAAALVIRCEILSSISSIRSFPFRQCIPRARICFIEQVCNSASNKFISIVNKTTNALVATYYCIFYFQTAYHSVQLAPISNRKTANLPSSGTNSFNSSTIYLFDPSARNTNCLINLLLLASFQRSSFPSYAVLVLCRIR